jgi:hypothetical protein
MNSLGKIRIAILSTRQLTKHDWIFPLPSPGNPQGLMHTDEVLPREVQCQRCFQVVPLLAEGVRQSGGLRICNSFLSAGKMPFTGPPPNLTGKHGQLLSWNHSGSFLYVPWRHPRSRWGRQSCRLNAWGEGPGTRPPLSPPLSRQNRCIQGNERA